MLKKKVDGVEYIFSQYLGKMIPRYVWAFDSDDCKFEWNETDLVYYNNAESFMFYETAMECGFLKESEYLTNAFEKLERRLNA